MFINNYCAIQDADGKSQRTRPHRAIGFTGEGGYAPGHLQFMVNYDGGCGLVLRSISASMDNYIFYNYPNKWDSFFTSTSWASSTGICVSTEVTEADAGLNERKTVQPLRKSIPATQSQAKRSPTIS